MLNYNVFVSGTHGIAVFYVTVYASRIKPEYTRAKEKETEHFICFRVLQSSHFNYARIPNGCYCWQQLLHVHTIISCSAEFRKKGWEFCDLAGEKESWSFLIV